ncbi:MAG: serine hydroxymethyltransferase [Proteobacteria bacterium]|nr:serine hydroxymethyltransferase [Pseudomonadota bacterium]
MQKPWEILQNKDPQVYQLIEAEFKRQQDGLELIASENFASAEVIASMGNVLANKYAEGLPGKRYYGGCEVVDAVETLAIERLTRLFGAKFANVQPHSGAQANAAVFLVLAKPGDRILGLDLAHGGHLTHGAKVNFSGLIYESHFYQLEAGSDLIDMNQVREQAHRVKPKILIAGASAYSRTLDFEEFRRIADEVGAYLVVDMAHIAGLVAAGLHPSPVPHAHVVTTTTHKTLRGPRGGVILWNDETLSKEINKGVFPGTQGGPLEHVIAAKAVCFQEALQPSFKDYQLDVVRNANTLANALIERGFKLVSGGTDNHLLLINLSDTPVSGKQLEEALGKIAITVNKNTVPGEKRSPFVTSGIRIGTPAVTTRGLRQADMEHIANWVKQAFDHVADDAYLAKLKGEVESFARRFPLYPNWTS